MDFNEIKTYEFFLELGYVTLISSVLTMLLTQLVKFVLKKKKIIYEGMEESEKDEILSKSGRIVALIIYSSLYIINEVILNNVVILDVSLVTGLISGSCLTLTISKGLYTMIHQYCNKKTVYERLKYAENIVKQMKEPVSKSDSLTEVISDLTNNEKWTISNEE